VIKGKLAYMAPEQLAGAAVTQRVDVFAAGVVLWELLTGQTLFRGDCDVATIRATLSRPIPPPSALVPALPRALDAVVLRALERDPDKRYRSAVEFLGALEQRSAPAATSRAVGEYVRSEVGAEMLSLHWESATFPKGTVAGDAPTAEPGVGTAEEVDASTPLVASAREDLPTRLHAPAPELVAATRSAEAPASPPAEPRSAVPDAYRARRLIVALVLILLGGAASVLFGSSSSSPAGAPAQATSPSQQTP
jgi:serine/threonine-protein kinase